MDAKQELINKGMNDQIKKLLEFAKLISTEMEALKQRVTNVGEKVKLRGGAPD